MKKLSLGIDIGGSHITCQLIDLQNMEGVIPKVRFSVNGNVSKEEILMNWTDAIFAAVDSYEMDSLSGIGFAMPGPFDYKKGVAWFDKNVDKFHDLNGVDIKSELLRRLALPNDFPIRFLNDASSFAVGEANVEPTSKYNRIIALTLGTGFGTTFIKNGLPVAGIDGIPDDGFLYHIPFKKSIADEYFSTRWFLKEYKKLSGEDIPGVKELAELAKTDLKARELFAKLGNNLGEFLTPWIQKFNAECIVIGGNISKSYSYFRSEMENQFHQAGIDIFVCQSVLDEDAALIGSAKLSDNEFYAKLNKTI